MSTSLPPQMTRREWRRRPAVPAETPVAHPVSDDDGAPRVLMVCTGNICRSPMAEVLLRARLGEIRARVHSAGTRALVGKEMPADAQELALEHGASPDDVSGHRARWLVESVASDADLILAMSREHRTAAVELAPRLLRQTFTVREFARLAAPLSTAQIRDTADSAGGAPRKRLTAVLALLAQQRGTVGPVAAEDDEVIDPYRRSRATYERSTAQLVPAIDEVARVMTATIS